MSGKRCALSGHRVLGDDFPENGVYDSLEEAIQKGYDYFLCGMAQGFDLYALECLIQLKQKYSIQIEACIPFEGQEKYFSQENKRRYRTYLTWCDKKTVLFEGYRNNCFLVRDRYMVDNADLLLAYCKEIKSGTGYTVRYAQKKGVPLVNLYEVL